MGELSSVQNRVPKPRAETTDSTVDRIVDAGEQLFADNGYEGTTLRQIAQKVGIREPSIYAHFAGKEAIYAAVIDRALQPFHLQIDSWLESELTLRSLFEIPRMVLSLHAEQPYAARILHREFCNPMDRISPKVMEWLEQIVQQSAKLMAAVPQPTGEQPSPQRVVIQIITITNMTLGFFSTQGMQQKLLGDAYDSQQLFEEHVALVSRILRGLVL